MILIQNYAIEIFVFLVLILLAFIDIKKKEFPAILTSGLLFVVAIVKFNNIEFGLLAFVLGWFLMEADFFKGIADLKIITILGFFITEMGMFFILVIMILIFGVVYKVLMVKVVKQKNETAFIPVLLAVYIALQLIQYLI
jgi:hypothetical protein